jgi:uncharacterized protein
VQIPAHAAGATSDGVAGGTSRGTMLAREPAMLWTYLIIGLGAGVLSGLFGIGGGIVIVPALMFFAKLAPQSATGTSLGALLLPVGALGVWAYWKGGHVDLRASLWIALGLFFGAYVGARFAQTLPPVTMKRMFAVFLVLVATRMWISAK